MIEIRHLQKSYGDVTPLRDINATIRDGDVISVIGPSGTGKSTLLNCINLLERPTSGQILIDGEDITAPRYDVCALRRKVGMVFQSFNLFGHLNVIENLMIAPMDLKHMSRWDAYRNAMALLEKVGLADRAFARPDELSGGQKQRVSIARTMAMEPEVILFDEPTSALDPSMTGEVEDTIRDLARSGMTMMIVTHDMDFARTAANRVFFLSDGVICEDGTPEAVFGAPADPKTRAFIYRLRCEEFTVKPDEASLRDCYGRIRAFEEKNRLTDGMRLDLDLIFDEAVASAVTELGETAEVSLKYSAGDETLEVRSAMPGAKRDPFADADEITRKLLESRTSRHEYRYENGVNTLRLFVTERHK